VTLETNLFVPVETPDRAFDSDRDKRSQPSYGWLRGLLGEVDQTVLVAILAGLLSCMALVAVAGRTARVSGATPPSSWMGLLDAIRPASAAAVGVVELGAVVVLVLAWWCLLKAARRLRPRVVVAVGMLWAIPLTLGPPLLSLDAYSYIAQGRLAALGIDPYASPPAALYGSWLQGVDPFWRLSLSPYGPLAVLLERIVALPGNAVAALVLLHFIALGALALVTVVVRHFAPSNQRSVVILLTVLNPVVLLQLLGAAHWEALLVALVAAALLAWQRGHPEAAIALASAAAAVKLPAGFALAVLLMLHVFGGPQGRRLRNSATGAAAAIGPWLLLSLVVPNAIGFVSALSTPMNGLTVYAPTTFLAEGVAYVWGLTGGVAPFDTILSVCRAGGVLLAAGVCCALLTTASRRTAGTTIGLGLLVVALLGPILYPWYLAWGLVPLAMGSRRYDRVLAVLSSAFIFTALPGLESLGQELLALGPLWVLTAVSVLIVVTIFTLVGRFGHLREGGRQKLSVGAQWQAWIARPESWRSIARSAASETPVRNRLLTTGSSARMNRIEVLPPKGLAHTGGVPLVSQPVQKAHPACANAIEVILDHSVELTPAAPKWQGSRRGVGDQGGVQDAVVSGEGRVPRV
jgi:alpha-1,6-mannosyltransferase